MDLNVLSTVQGDLRERGRGGLRNEERERERERGRERGREEWEREVLS